MTFNQCNTIAAISTAQGIGGIGVIRVSGDNAISIVDKIFKSVSGKKICDAKGYTAHYGHIINEFGEIVDEVIITLFRAPKSYTGEDVVEISCHGGLYITKSILRLVLAKGADPAGPGEFTKRAFLNGKIGLTQAEAVMDVIGAKNKQAAESATYAREGALNKRIMAVNELLVDLDSKLSVWVDYPDEEISEVSDESLSESLEKIKNQLNQLLKTYDIGKIIKDGVYTVIVGEPNVGKSTLMNLLSCCERSIVTNIPGTTRDVVEETVNIGDVTLRLADTAGIRDTDDEVEQIGVNKAIKYLNQADLILLVLDASKEISEDTRNLINQVKNKNVIAVVNKTDLNKKIDISEVRISVPEIVEISAINATGVENLANAVCKVTSVSQLDPSEGILSTERQAISVKRALDFVEEAIKAIQSQVTLDAVTILIEEAIEELLILTGERVSDVVVSNIFKKFCVGK